MAPKPPGGGGPPDDTETRLANLEAGHATILAKLDAIATKLEVMDTKLDAKADTATLERVGGEIRTSLATMQGEIAQKAAATTLSDLNGTVKNLPGIGSLITLVLGAIALSLGGAAGLAFALVRVMKP